MGQRKFLLHDLKLKKIPPGGGFHAWHYENGALCVAPRQFVVQLYLNDEFEGGETEFLYQQRREEAIAEMLLCSCFIYTYSQRKSSSRGTKYIATSWGIIQDESTSYIDNVLDSDSVVD